MCKTIIVWLVIFALGLGNALAQTKATSPEKQAEFKKHVVEWGTNKQVNVKLNSGEKLSGRIADIQNEFFVLQSVSKEGKVISREIHYNGLNKLSGKTNAGKVAGYTTLGVLAGVGVVFLVIFGVFLANES
ncbi:MAG: hypothetical protein JST84_06140 [Acidobacteria bacterium]|nr:hypothetical protein [Acidobacteriota bacterium]